MVAPGVHGLCLGALSEFAVLSDHHPGPWSHPPEPRPAPASASPPRFRLTRGFLIWVGLIGLGLVLYLTLQALFPGQVTGTDQAYALQMLGWLALVSSGLVFARRMRFGEVARNIGVWGAIAGVAILGYSFRNEAAAAFQRVRGELIPALAVPTGARQMTITASDDGGFYVMGQVNGAPVRFAIDTGANGVLLAPADAKRAGIDPDTLKFSAPGETANGVGYMAPVTLDKLTVGQIQLANVPAAVDKAPMSSSLLGMAFLKRLESFEVKGDQLTLRWRG
jgi:aspartyl protease family protein